ncbi:Malectin-like domain [Dillenia turbinata]|uniref:Malectin-like domain n=1 Tax=Dillenia turbinata TaxID=194707 RepID=A0AAN8VPB8_9MAGN
MKLNGKRFFLVSPIAYLIFHFTVHLGVSVSADESAFIATNSVLDCDSSTETELSAGRPWIPYYKSKAELSPKVGFRTSISDPQGPNLPKRGVCIFLNKSTHTFEVSSGPKFIRLHFYPVSYLGYDISKAIFSITSGKYTLMRTTSSTFPVKASLVIKEYCVYVVGESLNITFTPSPNSQGSYGFINMIEVVSVPENLYLRKNGSSTALETVYRVNVGGHSVSPNHDSGLSRAWAGDYDYLISREFSLPVESEVDIHYSSTVPAYYAPKEVYATARTAGWQQNGSYNLYWSFPIDSGFYYLVRLHFCDISDHQRAFSIFSNGQIVDMMHWSHNQGVPVYRDYTVNCTGLHGETQNLTILLQSVRATEPILNGLEILKLSDTKNNLGGPYPFRVTDTHAHEISSNSYRIPMIVLFCVSITVFVMPVLSFIYVWCYYSSKRQTQNPMFWPSSEQCQYFSLSELRLATGNFSNNCLIGEGGFGKVYKGSIDGGSSKVAVKRGNPGSSQGMNEFHTEISMLSRLRHRHLVSLIGFCMEDKEMILVYDFMAQGTIEEHEKYDEVNLADWVFHCHQNGTFDQIIDPNIAGTIKPECLKTFTGIARKCLADKGSERPTMSNVLWNLELAWQQQQLQECGETAENNGDLAIQMSAMIDGQHHLRNNNSDPTPGAEFSELIVPTGR